MSRPTEINISRFDWENSETLRVTHYLSQGFLRRNTDLLALKKYSQSFTDLPNELRTEKVYKFTIQTVHIIYVKMSQWRQTRVNMDECKRFAYHYNIWDVWEIYWGWTEDFIHLYWPDDFMFQSDRDRQRLLWWCLWLILRLLAVVWNAPTL